MQLSWILLMTPPPDGSSNGGSMIQTLIMFGTMAFIFYFMIFRPQKKRNKERAELLAKNCGKTKEQIMRDFDRDYWMDAKASVAYGIVDGIIEKL